MKGEKRKKASFQILDPDSPERFSKNRQKVTTERRWKDGESLGKIRERKGIFLK